MRDDRCAECIHLDYYRGKAICRQAGVMRELRWVNHCTNAKPPCDTRRITYPNPKAAAHRYKI